MICFIISYMNHNFSNYSIIIKKINLYIELNIYFNKNLLNIIAITIIE